jgi:transcriptional regulator with XRE-family HTH domain
MFGKNIKKIRNVKGLSQQAFAEMFDLKRAALGAYEEGRSNPKLETVLKIANHFHIGVDELLSTELTVNRLLRFNDSITTNTTDLQIEVFAQIPCITEALQADFIQHHNKKSFTDKMPRLHLPLQNDLGYIAYTVSNLEMTWQGKGFFPKDIVIGKKIESTVWSSIKTGALVLVLTGGRLIFRRAFVQNDKLVLEADYEHVDPIELALQDIVSLWEICHVFHYRLPAKTEILEDRLALLEKEILAMKKG